MDVSSRSYFSFFGVCGFVKLLWRKETVNEIMVFNFHYLQTVRHNSYADDPYAREFGIKISDRLAAVEARILPAPQVTE
jgi:hypothetical protein